VNETATKPDCARDRHLFGPGPKRVLSLDGGGVRGAISVAFLEQIEKVLTENLKKKVRLGDYFDLIGGTSTGAIIAGALALGYSIEDVKKFYFELAPANSDDRSGGSWACRQSSTRRRCAGKSKTWSATARSAARSSSPACALSPSGWIPVAPGSWPTIPAHPIGRRFPPIRRPAGKATPATSTTSSPTWCARARRRRSISIRSGCRSSKASRPGCSSTAA
jgi:hypothetical protein